MKTLNNLMNAISTNSEKYSFENSLDIQGIPFIQKKNSGFKRHVITRIQNLECVPFELTASLQHLAILPLQILQALAKYLIAKPVSFCFPKMQQFERNLAGVEKITITAAKALVYFVGMLVTFALGTLSPRANLWVHEKMHLYSSQELAMRNQTIYEIVESATLHSKSASEQTNVAPDPKAIPEVKHMAPPDIINEIRKLNFLEMEI